MKKNFQDFGVLLAATLLLAAGCATDDAPPLPESYAGAYHQIRQWIALGTPTTDAKKIMQQHGFTCAIEHNTRLSADVVIDDIYCELVWPASPAAGIMPRRWQAFLVLRNDKVSDIIVRTDLAGR